MEQGIREEEPPIEVEPESHIPESVPISPELAAIMGLDVSEEEPAAPAGPPIPQYAPPQPTQIPVPAADEVPIPTYVPPEPELKPEPEQEKPVAHKYDDDPPIESEFLRMFPGARA
jgi:hypothetical protein